MVRGRSRLPRGPSSHGGSRRSLGRSRSTLTRNRVSRDISSSTGSLSPMHARAACLVPRAVAPDAPAGPPIDGSPALVTRAASGIASRLPINTSSIARIARARAIAGTRSPLIARAKPTSAPASPRIAPASSPRAPTTAPLRRATPP
jgi:hypothetical protein